jgi:hypothetical protein
MHAARPVARPERSKAFCKLIRKTFPPIRRKCSSHQQGQFCMRRRRQAKPGTCWFRERRRGINVSPAPQPPAANISRTSRKVNSQFSFLPGF